MLYLSESLQKLWFFYICFVEIVSEFYKSSKILLLLGGEKKQSKVGLRKIFTLVHREEKEHNCL